MGKRHLSFAYDEATPQGPITDANPPVPVIATISWVADPRGVEVRAWAAAWTRSEVLIFWRDPDNINLSWLWVQARQVRRP